MILRVCAFLWNIGMKIFRPILCKKLDFEQKHFEFEYWYPYQLLILAITITYSAVAPSIILFGCLYFAASFTVFSNRLLTVHSREFDKSVIVLSLLFDKLIYSLIIAMVLLFTHTL